MKKLILTNLLLSALFLAISIICYQLSMGELKLTSSYEEFFVMLTVSIVASIPSIAACFYFFVESINLSIQKWAVN